MLPDYAPRGLQVIASAIDDGAQNAVPVFIKYHHPVFPVGFDDSVPVLDFCGYSRDRLPHLPILLFIDRQGTVRDQHEGADADFFGDKQEERMRAAIDSLFAGAAKPGAAKPAVKKKG